jgi:signal transduction histidine kinase
LIVGAMVYYWSKDFYIAQARDSLLNDIEIISFELQKDSNLDMLAKNIRNNINLRLTIISQDGTVIAESDGDKTKMDNHRYRDEIVQADKNKYGYKIRHSKTINKNLLYVAKKFNLNNHIVYIRLAKELKNINEQIFLLGMKILVVLMLFFIAIFSIAYNITKKVEKETQKIVTFLTSLTKKKKTTYISSDFSLEFSKITKLLSKVSQILTKKEKQKSKYTSKLQLANQQKDDIISAISHEFKNPIAVINGYAQTLLDDENLSVDMRKKFLAKIYKNGDKLSSLIDTLRLSVKLDSKKQNMNFSNINLYNTIVESVENIKLNYPNRKTIINGERDIVIKADQALFGVVIANLVENAFKYSEDEVKINFNEKSMEIIDTGIGISPKNLQNITDKFYRVSNNSWNNSLGLGLFIVSNIVNLHKFSLHIKSKENEGSTFSIRF